MKRLLRLLAAAAVVLSDLPARAETIQDLEAVDANRPQRLGRCIALYGHGRAVERPGRNARLHPEFYPLEQRCGRLPDGRPMAGLRPGRPARATGAGSSAGWARITATCRGNRTMAATVTRTAPGWPRPTAWATDPATGYAFRKGDLVTVTANGSLFYGGMQNINEEHSTDPANDFSFSLVCSNYGLPAPEVISLSSVISTNLSPTGHYDLFDPTRATGGEHWQGMRVRINGLTLVTTDGWNTNSDWSARFCTATDGEGRQLPAGPSALRSRTRADQPLRRHRHLPAGIRLRHRRHLRLRTVRPGNRTLRLTPSWTIALKPVITWPGSLSNYQLQSRDSLASTNWSPVTNAPSAGQRPEHRHPRTLGGPRVLPPPASSIAPAP